MYRTFSTPPKVLFWLCFFPNKRRVMVLRIFCGCSSFPVTVITATVTTTMIPILVQDPQWNFPFGRRLAFEKLLWRMIPLLVAKENNRFFGDQTIQIWSPILGEMIQFDEHIFQMGWFNHQLDTNVWSFPGIFTIKQCFVWVGVIYNDPWGCELIPLWDKEFFPKIGQAWPGPKGKFHIFTVL